MDTKYSDDTKDAVYKEKTMATEDAKDTVDIKDT